MRRALVLLTFALAALSSTSAFAQRYGYGWGPPPGPYPIRQGLIFGGSLGFGVMYQTCSGGDDSCTSSLGGGAAEIHLGGMITPQLAIMGEVAAMAATADEDGNQLVHITVAAAVRYYFLNRFFIEGGVGFGHLEFEDSNGDTLPAARNAFSITASLGVELIQRWRWSLNLNVRDVSTFYDPTLHNISFNIGVDWF